jgi:hypothetical protein
MFKQLSYDICLKCYANIQIHFNIQNYFVLFFVIFCFYAKKVSKVK